MKIVKSPLLFVGPVTFLISGVLAIYYFFIETEDFSALAGAYLFLIATVIGFALIIEQLVLNKFRPRKSWLWASESLMLLALVVYFIYQNRETVLQVNQNTEWFVVIEDQSSSQVNAQRSFPFDINIKIPRDNILVINPREFDTPFRFRITGNDLWDAGFQATRRSIKTNSRSHIIDVYFPVDADMNDTAVEEILHEARVRME